MLSSILQQNGDVPEIVTSISYTKNNGDPTTEEVIKFFREKGLNIIDVVMDEKEVHCRSIPRNKRLKETDADFILFADGDMVYDINFFNNLKKKLESTKWENETRAMGCDRMSLEDAFCLKWFEEDNREYPCIIDNVGKIASEFPVKWQRGGDTCAGFFQLGNVKLIRERDIVYSGRNRDVWRATKSDREFRIRMGGRVGINEPEDKKNNVELKMWHLNHDRGGPDIQR